MTQSSRKLLGVILTLALVIAYPLVIAVFYASFLSWMPWWAALMLFAVLGLLWFFPASWIIRWMARPD